MAPDWGVREWATDRPDRVSSRRWRRYSKSVGLATGRRTIVLRLLNRRRRADMRPEGGRRHRLALVPRPQAAISLRPPPAPVPVARAAAPRRWQRPIVQLTLSSARAADPMVLDRGATPFELLRLRHGRWLPDRKVNRPRALERRRTGHAWPTRLGPADRELQPVGASVIEKVQACPGSVSGPCFVMFYTAKHASLTPPANCIGVATSPTPAGPFSGPRTVAERRRLGRSERPSHRLRGRRRLQQHRRRPLRWTPAVPLTCYLSTGHRCPAPAPHARVRVGPDDLGDPAELPTCCSGDRPAQARCFERRRMGIRPWWRTRGCGGRGGVYELFYSGGVYSGAYGMGYATRRLTDRTRSPSRAANPAAGGQPRSQERRRRLRW